MPMIYALYCPIFDQNDKGLFINDVITQGGGGGSAKR